MKMLHDYESGGGMFSQRTTKGRQIPFPRNLRLAKAQQDAQTTGKLSVKFLDKDNAVISDAFDIYIFSDKAETDYTAYILALTGATIATDDDVWIKKGVGGSWYLDSVLIKTDTVLVVGNFDSGDGIDVTGALRANETTLTVLAKSGDTKVTQVGTTASCP